MSGFDEHAGPEADPEDGAGGAMHMDADTIRALGYRIVDVIAEELGAPARRPIYPPPQTRAELERVFGGDAPAHGEDPFALVDSVRERLLPAHANYVHPQLLAYISSTPLPLAGLIEALVASLRLFPYTWTLSPACSLIEVVVARWLGQMAGFAPDAPGYLTTGGSWANLVGLAVARVRRAGFDVKGEGLAGHPPLVAYTSEEAHACHEQGARLLGLGSAGLTRIAVDDAFRLRPDALERAIEADRAEGRRPFCVIATAGTTNTGAVDPLEAIADVAARHGLWLHVDGAYGAFAALAPETRPLLAGLARADSLALDPHKWLNVPYEAGCILVREWRDLEDTFSLVPAYLEAGNFEGHHDHWRHGFELTRTDRALKVWLAIRQHGVERFRAMIREHLALTRRLGEWVEAAEDMELASAPSLSVCCFRYAPPEARGDDAYLDRLNFALERALAADGRGLFTGTRVRGRRVLRACIVNHKATWAGVRETLELVRALGRGLHAELDGAGGGP